MARCYKNGRAKALLFVAILFRYLIYTFLIFQEFYPLYNRIITKMRSDREKEGGKKMYGNYNTGYGMNPYQQQLAQNRLNQMEQQYNVGTYQPNNYQMQNNDRNTQRIIDHMTQNEVQTLRDQLQTANFQLSQQAQSANIIGQLRPTPTPAYLTCSPYESNVYATRGFYGAYGNGCGCNSCC